MPRVPCKCARTAGCCAAIEADRASLPSAATTSRSKGAPPPNARGLLPLLLPSGKYAVLLLAVLLPLLVGMPLVCEGLVAQSKYAAVKPCSQHLGKRSDMLASLLPSQLALLAAAAGSAAAGADADADADASADADVAASAALLAGQGVVGSAPLASRWNCPPPTPLPGAELMSPPGSAAAAAAPDASTESFEQLNHDSMASCRLLAPNRALQIAVGGWPPNSSLRATPGRNMPSWHHHLFLYRCYNALTGEGVILNWRRRCCFRIHQHLPAACVSQAARMVLGSGSLMKFCIPCKVAAAFCVISTVRDTYP